MQSSIVSATLIAAFCSTLVPSLASAAEQDKEAIHQLLAEFRQARATNDRKAMANLYTQDSVYFHRSGREAFGNKAVVDLLFAPASTSSQPSASPSPPTGQSGGTQPPFSITDTVEADGRLGYVYGRTGCQNDSAGKPVCAVRYFLVMKKSDDGKWRIQADIDTPHLGSQR